MSDIAVRVEHLSTRYRIGPRERYEALRDVITDVFAAPFRRLRENSPFAIRNVSPAAFCLLPSAFWSFTIRNSKSDGKVNKAATPPFLW
jgi:hypothetical protein